MAEITNTNTNNTATQSAEEIRAMAGGKLLDYIKGQFETAGLPIPQELSGVLNPPTPEAPAMEPVPAPEENPVTYGVPTPQMLNNIWGAPTPAQAPPQMSSAAELQLRVQQQLQMEKQMAMQEQMQQQMLQMQKAVQMQYQQMQLQQQQLAELQRRNYADMISMFKTAMKAVIEIAKERGIAEKQVEECLYKTFDKMGL